MVKQMEPTLAGYMGFTFGEGQQKNDPAWHVGGLMDRKLQVAFDRGTSREWKADCICYTAHFDTSKDLPSQETQKQTVLKFFKDQGATVLKAEVKTEDDAEAMGFPIRTISVQLPLEDLQKVRESIINIDTAANGAHSRRQKIQGPKLR